MLFTIIFVISAVFGEVIEPECRYAATAAHYYPIGICESDRLTTDGTTTEFSFRYVCDENNVVLKESFDGVGCMGEAEIDTNVTFNGEIIDSSCEDAMACSYAMICSFSQCGNVNDTTCSQCAQATPEQLASYDVLCRPYISGECYGAYGVVHETSCENGLAVSSYYWGSNCTDDTGFLYDERDGGADVADYCRDGDFDGLYTYYTADCKVATTTAYPDSTNIPESIDAPEGSNQFISVYSLFISSALFFYIL